MVNKKEYFNFFKKNYFSEKSSFLLKKNNTLVFKVNKNINKLEILFSIKKIFNLNVKKIRTLLVKKKKKNKNSNTFYFRSWKKVFIIFKKNQNLDFNNLLK